MTDGGNHNGNTTSPSHLPKGQRPKAPADLKIPPYDVTKDPAVNRLKSGWDGNDRSDWTPEYFRELVNYDPKHFGLPHEIKPFKDEWRVPESDWLDIFLFAVFGDFLLAVPDTFYNTPYRKDDKGHFKLLWLKAKRDTAPVVKALPKTAADRLDPAVVAEVDRVNRAQEKNNIAHDTGVDPEDLEEIWVGLNFSLDNWAMRDARLLVNGYQLYPCPGVPIGCDDPGVVGVLFYVVMYIPGADKRIIVAAVGNHGELLYKANRTKVRDYVILTKKLARRGQKSAPFSARGTLQMQTVGTD